MINHAPQSLHSQPVIGVGCSFDWPGREIDELRPWLFGAVAGYQLDGQSTVPTADTASISASAGPLATLTFRCATGGAVPFLTLESKGECKRMVAQLEC